MKTILVILAFGMTSHAVAQSASYDAGTAGNPAVAPDPAAQGWTLEDPSGGQVTIAGLSPDPGTGLNAWSIDDQATFVGGRANYNTLFGPAEITDAADLGWDLTVNVRMIATSGLDMYFEYASGSSGSDDRYLVFLEISGTDVIANALVSGQLFTCTGAHDGNYHAYTIHKPAGAANVDAEFFFDGVSLGILSRAGSNGSAPTGGVNWGSGSSVATATANFNRIEFTTLSGGMIGSNYCMANPNSTGAPSSMNAIGRSSVAQNDVTLDCSNLPVNAFGFFLAGMTQGFTANPGGSEGNLCLSGAIGRYVGPGQIQQAGASGTISLMIDLTQTPTPNGLVSIAAGETWNFQTWHRDTSMGGQAVSNFPDGLAVVFL